MLDLRIVWEPPFHSSVTEVVLSGELDFSTAGRLRDCCSVLLKPAGPVLLDLSAVEFLDCEGARALLRMHQVAGMRGATWAVVTGDGWTIHGLLALLRWADTMPLYRTREEALARLAAEEPGARRPCSD